MSHSHTLSSSSSQSFFLLNPSRSVELPLDPRTEGRFGRLAVQSPLTGFTAVIRRAVIARLSHLSHSLSSVPQKKNDEMSCHCPGYLTPEQFHAQRSAASIAGPCSTHSSFTQRRRSGFLQILAQLVFLFSFVVSCLFPVLGLPRF